MFTCIPLSCWFLKAFITEAINRIFCQGCWALSQPLLILLTALFWHKMQLFWHFILSLKYFIMKTLLAFKVMLVNGSASKRFILLTWYLKSLLVIVCMRISWKLNGIDICTSSISINHQLPICYSKLCTMYHITMSTAQFSLYTHETCYKTFTESKSDLNKELHAINPWANNL